jgi:hypothetical protein
MDPTDQQKVPPLSRPDCIHRLIFDEHRQNLKQKIPIFLTFQNYTYNYKVNLPGNYSKAEENWNQVWYQGSEKGLGNDKYV